MDSDIPGHPIQFIDIDQDEDNKKYNFNINPDAIAVLQELKDKKVHFFIRMIRVIKIRSVFL